jgi:tRNA (cmo5U34)-methyltransferase
MTDSHPAAIFERQAAGYDAQRRRLIPPFDAFYGTAVDAIGLIGSAPRRVLDLGAGTGLLSRAIAVAYPEARLTLTDAAPAMLERARSQLGDSVRYVVADLAGPLPDGGPWCAVVSSLAIHHLDDAGKRSLLQRVHDALAPGGVFVNAEQVAGPSARFDAAYRAWHRERATRAGSSREEWAGAQERMAFDRCADVESQLEWLRDAGFDADCLFKEYRFAVLVGLKPR